MLFRSLRSGSAPTEIGIPNEFVVQQIYDDAPSEDEEASSVARKPGPSVVVTGTLSHTIVVDQNADRVMAWLAPRRHFANFEEKTGLLLKGCTEGVAPCMFNECSLQRKKEPVGGSRYQGAGMRESANENYLNPDPFWETWQDLNCADDSTKCVRRGSPALETFVPLCSPWSGAKFQCGVNRGVNNYYSPVSSVPDLVEVAVTKLSRFPYQTTQWLYKGYNPYSPAADRQYRAPHQGFRVHSYDYDGHQMTHYTPQLYSELQGGRHKMGWADYMLSRGLDPFVNAPDPFRDASNPGVCPDNDVCCTEPNLLYSMRVDCVETDALQCESSDDCKDSKSPVEVKYWPAVREGAGKATGCRYVFDGDRDGKKAQGNIIKPDFSMDTVPANAFTQHVLNTVDFPFTDMDNKESESGSHINNDRINWEEGQTVVQNVFSMFTCDAGEDNQPPFFVKGLCAGFSNVNACEDSTNVEPRADYECAFWETCEIDLYARDFDLVGDVSTRPPRPVANLNPSPATTETKISIQYALGYDHLPEDDIEPVNANGVSDPGSASTQLGQAHFRYTFKPTSAQDVAHLTTTDGIMTPQSIGKVFVRCFVAYDIFDTEGRSTDEKAQARSCPSMPLCIKIRITGSKPEFVAPTPLGESFDDNGILVPDRHDFPACQGSPMRLQLTARDSMPAAVRAKLLLTPEGNAYLKSLRFRILDRKSVV